ncbi:MAG: HD domain-containing protein [Betaproteobacteria bacterium]|nr:HD domain-containing protein [Betaproteobacteria bacterium]
MLSIEDICALYREKGHLAYSGEPVTQLQHALQTAQLAELAGAGASLVTACLLHDLGHILADRGETPTERGIDDTHQYFAIPFLRGLFGAQVLEPIRLHVDAKRYLCCVRGDYQAALSADSRRSLQLQGGVFSPAQAEAFISQPHAQDAVKLRQWDDLAKEAGLATPDLAHFVVSMRACALARP